MSAPNRCLVSVIIFVISLVGIIAVASLVMGFMLALYTNPDNSNGDRLPPMNSWNNTAPDFESGLPYEDPRIWLITLGEFDHKFEYLDDETEQVRGFNVDIITGVCRLARKRCRLVYDDYGNCFINGRVGTGLMNRYYDACTGWAVTYERLQTAAFTNAYAQASGSYFVTSPGRSAGFDPSDLTNTKIGFLIGWDADEICANRLTNTQGLPLREDQVMYYVDASALSDALSSGEVDAGFIVEDTFDPNTMEIASEETSACLAGQVSMMTTPTSRGLEFIQWWNYGLDKLTSSTEYNNICDRLQTVHGHKAGGDKYDICLTNYLPSL
ncbi:uncharacterized protein [Amphiura filiformis]|uniref:uncharacterized protein n=1 Tax=Amphiura filiformis TaxID=82378 RepID=UPI003B20E163